MVMSIALVMAVIGALIAGFIGILILDAVTESIDCSTLNEQLKQHCEDTISRAWIVIASLPIILGLTLWLIFRSPEPKVVGPSSYKQFYVANEKPTVRKFKPKPLEITEDKDVNKVDSILGQLFRRGKKDDV